MALFLNVSDRSARPDRGRRTMRRSSPGPGPAQLRRAGRAAARGHLRRRRSGDHRRIGADRGDHRDRRGQGPRRRGARRVRHPGRPGPVDPAADHHAHRHHRLDGATTPRGSAPCCPSFLEFIRGCVLVAHNARSTSGSSRPPARRLGAAVAGPGRGRHRPAGPQRAQPGTRRPASGCPRSPRCSGRAVAPDHRALTDARATVDVLHALFERLGSLGVHSLVGAADASRDVAPERRRKRRSGRSPAGRARASTCSAGRATRCCTSAPRGNLHQRVRSYFSAAETRDRIKHMVTLAERVDHVECAHALEAHIREQRLIAVHQPPYNRRSREPGKVCWVTLTDEAVPAAEHRPDRARRGPPPASARSPPGWPRRPRSRRCRTRCRSGAARCGSGGVDPDGSPCALAELGRCGAPCAGAEDERRYAAHVDRIRRARSTAGRTSCWRCCATG